MHFFVANSVSAIVGACIAQQAKVAASLVGQEKVLSFSCRGGFEKLVEDVVVPFAWARVDKADFFQQVRFDTSAHELPILGERNIDVFSKAGGIVVANGSGISECFQNRVRLQDLLFDGNVAVGTAGWSVCCFVVG